MSRKSGEVLVAMVAMFNTGDVADVEAVIDDDYVDHQGLDGRPLIGPDGFRAVVQAARSGYRALTVAIEDLVEQEGRAAARLRWRGVRRHGDVVERVTIEMVHVRDGRAVEHWGARS